MSRHIFINAGYDTSRADQDWLDVTQGRNVPIQAAEVTSAEIWRRVALAEP